MSPPEVFQEISVIIVIAAIVGAIAVALRQPLIVAFIAVGVLVGPAGMDLVTAADEIDLLAEMGIALLLFVVGLKLDLRLIRTVGPVALATGLGQVAFTSIVGFGLGLALGLDTVTAAFVAVAITFSSTIIIVKLLSDKREIDDLHGRIAVGFLIVQDIVVVLAMIGLTAFGAGEESPNVPLEIAGVFGKGVALLLVVGLVMKFGLTPLFRRLAHSSELLILAAIAWGVGLAAGADALGFSPEVGAFLGGVSLASTPYREAIGARLVPLRDFLLLFFFIELGSGLDLSDLGGQLDTAVALSLFVLIGNPLIVMVIMGTLGYRRKVGFLAGLTVSQISEFSLILAALAVSVGAIGQEALALVTAVGLMTISASTYAILYSHWIYERLSPWLGVFERDRDSYAGDDLVGTGESPDVVLYGLGRYGRRIGDELAGRGHEVLGVDYDPKALDEWAEVGRPSVYGDMEDTELPGELPLDGVRWVVASVPRVDENVALMGALKRHGFEGKIAVTAHRDKDERELYERGADLVLRPFASAAEKAASAISPDLG